MKTTDPNHMDDRGDADATSSPQGYEAPSITDLGSLTDLTLGGVNVGSDGLMGGGAGGGS
jgi:hypothetical protein